MQGYYDVAQICLNGHVINSSPKGCHHNEEFCSSCGEKTITECPSCRVSIRGDYHSELTIGLANAPAFCHNCGKAYPWTENKIQTAIQIFAEFGGLDDGEKKTIEDDIRNISRDIPQAELSAMRIKRIWQKYGQRYGKIAYNVIMEFVSKTAAEILKHPE